MAKRKKRARRGCGCAARAPRAGTAGVYNVVKRKFAAMRKPTGDKYCIVTTSAKNAKDSCADQCFTDRSKATAAKARIWDSFDHPNLRVSVQTVGPKQRVRQCK